LLVEAWRNYGFAVDVIGVVFLFRLRAFIAIHDGSNFIDRAVVKVRFLLCAHTLSLKPTGRCVFYNSGFALRSSGAYPNDLAQRFFNQAAGKAFQYLTPQALVFDFSTPQLGARQLQRSVGLLK